jgi:uncharacterized membrane protein
MDWLRRSFLTGFFVTVPLLISVATIVWLFRLVDGWTTPLYDRLIGFRVPGLGILSTAIIILIVGAVASNVIGKRLLNRTENILLKVPLFRTIYAPVKQLVVAFSPDNEYGFKQVVLLEGKYGYVLGFLTKEFTVERAAGPEPLIAVYVPTNHLYMGDIVVCERSKATFPDITVEEGIRIFLTGGMALPDRIRGTSPHDRPGDFRV